MEIKITKDKINVESIRYHLKVNRRSNEGFGTLKRYCAGKMEYYANLRLSDGDIVAVIEDFFPNGYCSYPYYPTTKDKIKMRRGVGSILLTEMIKGSKEEFSAKKMIALNCSNSLLTFLLKHNFTEINCSDRSYYLSLCGDMK